MTAQWTIDDLPDGLVDDLGSALAMALGLDDSDEHRDFVTDALNAIAPHLVADVRAARLVDDMATALTEALDAFEECTGDYAKELCADDLARWREVAALDYARQQDDR